MLGGVTQPVPLTGGPSSGQAPGTERAAEAAAHPEEQVAGVRGGSASRVSEREGLRRCLLSSIGPTLPCAWEWSSGQCHGMRSLPRFCLKNQVGVYPCIAKLYV